jgi:hypothetical protein
VKIKYSGKNKTSARTIICIRIKGITPLYIVVVLSVGGATPFR